MMDKMDKMLKDSKSEWSITDEDNDKRKKKWFRCGSSARRNSFSGRAYDCFRIGGAVSLFVVKCVLRVFGRKDFDSRCFSCLWCLQPLLTVLMYCANEFYQPLSQATMVSNQAVDFCIDTPELNSSVIRPESAESFPDFYSVVPVIAQSISWIVQSPARGDCVSSFLPGCLSLSTAKWFRSHGFYLPFQIDLLTL